ncbi:MAG: hypothetical protein VX923_05070 [Pseudomonadota bacterium]|nr:hypothetical protein [Pseudomonadota bacterium]
MDIRKERKKAVAETIVDIRKIEGDLGVNNASLEVIKDVLLGLADKKELFPKDQFPIEDEDGNSVLFKLSEDDDHRFALYASAAIPKKNVNPHNHTTWAVIVGLYGNERNVFYERLDDGSKDGIGIIKPTREFVVTHGNGVVLMPDDIHSIHVTGDKKTVHLHMYGLALEQLHHRIMFNTLAGTYKVFPATKNIKVA